MNILPLHFSEGLREATQGSGIIQAAKEARKVVQPVARYLSTSNSCALPLEPNRLQNKVGLLDCFQHTLGVKISSQSTPHHGEPSKRRAPRSSSRARTNTPGLVRPSLSSVSLKHISEESRCSSTTASSESVLQSDTSSPPTSRAPRRCRSLSRPRAKGRSRHPQPLGESPVRLLQRKPTTLWDAFSSELAISFSKASPQATKPAAKPHRVLSRPTLRCHGPRAQQAEATVGIDSAPRRSRPDTAATAKPDRTRGTGPCVDTAANRVARKSSSSAATPASVRRTVRVGEVKQRDESTPGVRSTGTSNPCTSGFGSTQAGLRQEPSAGQDRRRGETQNRGCGMKPSDRSGALARLTETAQKGQFFERKAPIAFGSQRFTLFPRGESDRRHRQHQPHATCHGGLGGAATPKRETLGRASANVVSSSSMKDTTCGVRARPQRATQNPSVSVRRLHPQAKGSLTPHVVTHQSERPPAAVTSEGPGRSRERGVPSGRRSGSKRPPNVPKLDLRKCIQYRTRD
uniref:Uncharacterized protein n=1 Tax=Neospora caninum (strain Liverpool) TaxID=572307 RepID=A0A0F7ULC0_NEOCL|nr:TPA: hypothetical protein BN1204_050385 [Neospora caninum Liverpool]